MGWLCHNIHLNPARVGICPAEQQRNYRWGSCWHWRRRKQRPLFLDFEACLEGAGGLNDTAAGWTGYERYLGWLAGDKVEQRRQEFSSMSRGWALGTKLF